MAEVAYTAITLGVSLYAGFQCLDFAVRKLMNHVHFFDVCALANRGIEDMQKRFTFREDATVPMAFLLAPDFPETHPNSVFYRLDFAMNGVVVKVVYMSKSAKNLVLFMDGACVRTTDEWLLKIRDDSVLSDVTIFLGTRNT